MTARIAGHTLPGLRAQLRHEMDELFAMDLDDPRSAAKEQDIIAVRKQIRKQLKEDLQNELEDAKRKYEKCPG